MCVCVTCLCLLEEAGVSVCFGAGWDVWFITLIGLFFFFFFQTAALQKVKEGEEERDDRERSLTD